MSSRVYLVSKAFDPLIGIASGLWAYQLYESRQNRPEGHTLPQLLVRKWNQRMEAKKEKELVLGSEVEGWAELEKELKGAQSGVRFDC